MFTRVPQGRTRSNGHKLLEDGFRLDVRKNFFTVRVAKFGIDFPRRFCSPQPWKSSRGDWADTLLGSFDLSSIPAQRGRVGLDDLSRSPPAFHFYDFYNFYSVVSDLTDLGQTSLGNFCPRSLPGSS